MWGNMSLLSFFTTLKYIYGRMISVPKRYVIQKKVDLNEMYVTV